jgi:palmitoyltransferase
VQILDDQDVDGYTPLHLAVKSAEQLRSTRPVRSLLIRGASRNVRDNRGQKPIDLVEEFEHGSLKLELFSLLKEPTGCSCLMLKTPLKLMRKSPTTSVFFICLYACVYTLLYLFVLPLYQDILWPIIVSVCGGLVFLFFVLAFLRDPGYLKKPKKVGFGELLEQFDAVSLCPDCEVIRTKRSRHCSICNRCVERFDHHCPWINNCVGANNHSYFLLFLISVFVSLVAVLACMIYRKYPSI